MLPSWLRSPDKGAKLLHGENYTVLDVETTNLEKGHARNSNNRLLMVSWSLGRGHPNQTTTLKRLSISEFQKRGVRSTCHVGNEYEQGLLLDHIRLSDFIVCHNAKFELQWLTRCGLDLYNILAYCTQVGEYVNRSNRLGSVSLEESLKRHGLGTKEKLVSTLIGAGICPSEIPVRLLSQYNKVDVEQTHRLFLKQREKYKALFPVISTRCYAIPMLAKLELTGLQLTNDVVELNSTTTKDYNDLCQEFENVTGGINFNSHPQVAEYLYEKLKFTEPINPRSGEPEKTDGGKRKTDKVTIDALKATTPEQHEFKKLKLALGQLESDSRVLSKLNECYKNDNGTLFFNFNNTVVNTGRLSSAGGKYKLQGQNTARKFKKLFGPRKEGNLIGEIDYPNHEWRIAGHFGRDEQLRRDVLSGFRVHEFSAEVFGIDRQSAKAETFRPLFGSKGQTPKQKKYAIEFRKRWAGVDAVQRGWANECVRYGCVTTETGWKFYWPAKLTRSGYIEYTTKIYDYPIQYFAGAECTMVGCLFLWYLAQNLESFMINTVHDSDIWEIYPQEREEWKELGIDSFTTKVYNYMLAQYNIEMFIPLGADIKIGPLWSVGDEDKIDVTLDGKRLRIRK